MEKFTRIGLDTSKQVFQLHCVVEGEQRVVRKTLRRKQLLPFFEKLPATKVGLEACGAGHYWARELSKLGHEALLVPPQYARMYVPRGKHDAADAEGVSEAMNRPTLSFVPAKTCDQQAALMLASARDRLVRLRTQTGNVIRGYAAEFGFVAPKGLDKIEELVKRLLEEESVPKVARQLFVMYDQELGHIARQLERVDGRLMAWHKGNALSRRLAEIPGVGPIGAALMVMKTPDPKAFKSARHFAAWLGLTPRIISTAGKTILGPITCAGDEMLRAVIVAGAMSMVKVAQRKPERVSPWLRELVQGKATKVAAVALANKNARIAWKLMVTGERFSPQGRLPTAPVKAAA